MVRVELWALSTADSYHMEKAGLDTRDLAGNGEEPGIAGVRENVEWRMRNLVTIFWIFPY